MPKLLLSLLETRPLPTPAIKLYCISQPEGKKTKRDKCGGGGVFQRSKFCNISCKCHISLDHFIRENFSVGNQHSEPACVMSRRFGDISSFFTRKTDNKLRAHCSLERRKLKAKKYFRLLYVVTWIEVHSWIALSLVVIFIMQTRESSVKARC